MQKKYDKEKQKKTCYTPKCFLWAFEKMYLETDVFMLCGDGVMNWIIPFLRFKDKIVSKCCDEVFNDERWRKLLKNEIGVNEWMMTNQWRKATYTCVLRQIICWRKKRKAKNKF